MTSMMAHGATDVAMVKDPTESFCEGISNVDDTSNGEKNNMTEHFPFLNGEELYVDVSGAGGGLGCIDNEDGRCVIFVDWSSSKLREIQFRKNKADILDGFGTKDRSDKFSFGGANSGRCLNFGSIANSASAKGEDVTGDGTASSIGGMSSIHKSNQLRGRMMCGERWLISEIREGKGVDGTDRKAEKGGWAPIHDAPNLGTT